MASAAWMGHSLAMAEPYARTSNAPEITVSELSNALKRAIEDRFGYVRPAKDVEVVFYCKAGVRSRAAAALARDAGWTKVGEYPGSWIDWSEKGGKVERSGSG